MKASMLVLFVGAYAYGLSNSAGVTPIQKVVEMLQDMRAKGVQEKQDEQVSFAAYKQFCDDTSAAKQSSIEDANSQIEQLQADIQKAESDAATLASAIEGLDSDIAGWNQDKVEATRQRKVGNDDFNVLHKDQSESVDALSRALTTLKHESYDRTQGKSLLQKMSVNMQVPVKARRVIASFLATDEQVHQEGIDVSAPQANAYEFQSAGVVDMFQNLHDKFEDELRETEKDEMKAEHAFKLMMLSLENQISAAEKEREAKAATKAAREETAATARGDLSDTTADRDADATYLATLQSQCTQKSNDFESRQQLRSEELEAIQKAVGIIQSKELQGNGEKHLARERSFVLRGSVERNPLQKQIAAFLETRADHIGSRLLSMIAIKVTNDPFANVKKLIDDMITRLLEEASEESDHKGWCDTEMAKNKHTRDAKTEEINELQANADQLSAAISRLAQETSDLNAAIAEIDASVAEASKERKEESKTNKATVEDTRDAQTAVSQALAVLQEFYRKAAQATAFVQAPEDDSPATFDGAYTGMGDNAGGVVGMLEVIGSDFARVEAETTSAEAEAAKAHQRFLAASSQDKAVKTADADHKSKAQTQKESELNENRKDLQGTNAELDAALVYHENLKPSCNDATVSYSDKVARREEEISALKEALQILAPH